MLAALIVVLVPVTGGAQQGGQVKVIAAMLSVRHRVGPTGSFVPTKVGALLPPGSRLQTGARSKCALKFPDGGVIRVDQNSDLIIQSAAGTSLKLTSGRLWAKVIAGTTARVQGASGVAVVKGTEWTFDGQTITCYDGDVAYETAAGSTDVPAGFSGSAGEGGQVSVEPAPGRNYPGADLIQWFGGLREGTSVAATPGSPPGGTRRGADWPIDGVITGAAGAPGDLHVIIEGRPDRAQTAPGLAGGTAASWRRLSAFEPWGSFPGVNPNNLAPVGVGGPGLGGTLTVADLGTERQGEPLGKQYFFGPYTLMDTFGYVADNGSSFGFRARPHVVYGPWYFEAGVTPHTSSWYGDGVDVSELFAMLRRPWGEVTIGRQRFLEGPVNNSRLGSILSFETGDAVRFKTDLDKFTFDAAYVETMSPIIRPHSAGWYGRVSYPVAGGTVAANLVRHDGGDVGWSADLSLPVVRGYLDAYGEVGRDSWGRNLHTIGMYCPWLYQHGKMDLFVEFADRDELPGQATVRLYKHFGDHLTTVLAIDKRHDDDLGFGAGVVWRFGG